MDFRELNKTWRIACSLAFAGFKIKNERSYLGIFWYLLDPIILFTIFMTIRGVFSNTNFEAYPIYLFTGLICFNFFRKSTSQASGALLSGTYINSVNFPKVSLVISKVIDSLISHAFEIFLVIILMIYFSIPVWNIFLIIPFLFFYTLFVIGIGQVISILGVYINDISNVWSVFTRILWFATPIFYVVQEENFVNTYNPLTYFINSFREIVLEGKLFTGNFLSVVIISIASIIIGHFIFKWKSSYVAEEL